MGGTNHTALNSTLSRLKVIPYGTYTIKQK